MPESFAFADDLGPERTVEITDPGTRLRAVVVIDNTAAGPAIGGTRMAPDATAEECFRLARAMTFKNAAAGIPHGGAKSVIVADPRMDPAAKTELIRAFGRALRDVLGYIPGPDMGTNETAMALIRDECGRACGLPPELGGIPLDEIGATGRGLAVAAEAAADAAGLPLKGARVAIQGWGAVGRWTARFLAERGAMIVAAADIDGAVHAPAGLDPAALDALAAAGRSVAEAEGGTPLPREAIIGVDCDILVPAARPDAIHEGNVEEVKAKIVLEGANIPTTEAAGRRLHARGILAVPDIVANAGGVITCAVEWRGGSREDAEREIEAKLRANTAEILAKAKAEGTSPRDAAFALAEARVRRAMTFRR
ncbi:MAG: Glu/Leu/Phe/Val dehydrogenase [Paracoccaceae bacterium]